MKRRLSSQALFPFLIVVAGVVPYLGSFSGTFVLDDKKHIVSNPRIEHVFPLSETLSGPRPVVDLTLAINRSLGQGDGTLDPYGFHVVNIFIHILAGFTLFGTVRRTFPIAHDKYGVGTSPCGSDKGNPGPDRRASWIALTVSVIWMVHPLQTQSITYIIQRAESLAGLFYLLAVYCLIRGAGAQRSLPWYMAAIVACALGMGSKAVVVTAPVVLLIYDRTFLSGSVRAAIRIRWPVYLGLAGCWFILLASGVAQHVFSTSADTAAVGLSFRGATPLSYALTQLGVLAHYLRLAAWPHPQCLDYDWPLAASIGSIIGPSIVILCLLFVTIWGTLRNLWWSFLGLWFFLILAPTSSVVPIKDALFEHRMYLPLAAVVVLAVIGAEALSRRLFEATRDGRSMTREVRSASPRPLVICATMLVVVSTTCLGAKTFARNQVYENELGLWQDVLRKRPHHARAYLGLGTSLFRLNDLKGAEEAFEQAVRNRPDYAAAYYNLGKVRQRLGKLTEAEEAFRRSIQFRPDKARGLFSLANVLKKLDRADEAVSAYRQALQFEPGHVGALVNLGNAVRSLGQDEEAILHYRRALALRPDHAAARYNLAATLNDTGRTAEAIEELEWILRVNPKHRMARRLLERIRLQPPSAGGE